MHAGLAPFDQSADQLQHLQRVVAVDRKVLAHAECDAAKVSRSR